MLELHEEGSATKGANPPRFVLTPNSEGNVCKKIAVCISDRETNVHVDT